MARQSRRSGPHSTAAIWRGSAERILWKNDKRRYSAGRNFENSKHHTFQNIAWIRLHTSSKAPGGSELRQKSKNWEKQGFLEQLGEEHLIFLVWKINKKWFLTWILSKHFRKKSIRTAVEDTLDLTNHLQKQKFTPKL